MNSNVTNGHGFDPTKAQQPAPQETQKRGGGLRGAAGGALAGAAIGAASGGVVGGVRQRRQNRNADQANQQAHAQQQALMDQYNKAKAVCMEGRGYSVR